MHHFKPPPVSLHELARHGYIEHNASVVHKDTKKGHRFAPCRCDTVLMESLLEDEMLSVEKLAKRRVILEKTSPLDPLHQEIARGEWALVFDIFGRERGGKLQQEIMKVWLKENRFPEGWKPTHEQGLFATIQKANEIRKKMNEYRKHLDKDVLEGCLAEMDSGKVNGKQ